MRLSMGFRGWTKLSVKIAPPTTDLVIANGHDDAVFLLRRNLR
jgi:hypothetical protein